MNWLNDIIGVINNYLWSYVLIVMLIGIGLWFTVRTRFVQIRCIPEMFRLMTEGAGAKPREGHISTFQAFCVSTASRVGVGNIAGIAIAVATGGPGAVFWMWVIATIGAASGFVESTLAQIYKAPRKGGGFVGGPAYYIGNVIGSSFFASVFAVLLAVTYGLIFNSVQANTISLSMQTSFGFDTQMTGLAIAGFTALVIFGGLTRIAKVVGVMVPVMAGAYILVALAVTALNITMVPEVLVTIVRCAFDFDAVLGAGFGMALMTGIKRGLFSNEAGMGAVPNAAATADATHPAKQGLVQALGVYFDTLVVCTASAMLVLLTPGWADSGKTGIELIQQTLTGQLGTWTNAFMSVTVLFFAFSSIMVIMPLYIQDCRGYSATISGLVMLPGAFGQCIAQFFGGKALDRLGARPVALIGSITLLFGTIMMSLISMTSWIWWVSIWQFVRQIGMGFVLMPITTWSLNCLES